MALTCPMWDPGLGDYPVALLPCSVGRWAPHPAAGMLLGQGHPGRAKLLPGQGHLALSLLGADPGNQTSKRGYQSRRGKQYASWGEYQPTRTSGPCPLHASLFSLRAAHGLPGFGRDMGVPSAKPLQVDPPWSDHPSRVQPGRPVLGEEPGKCCSHPHTCAGEASGHPPANHPDSGPPGPPARKAPTPLSTGAPGRLPEEGAKPGLVRPLPPRPQDLVALRTRGHASLRPPRVPGPLRARARERRAASSSRGPACPRPGPEGAPTPSAA